MEEINIYVRGGGFSNKGDQAMGITVRQQLSKRISRINFWNRVPAVYASNAWASGCFASVNKNSRITKIFQLLNSALTNHHVRKAVFSNPLSALEILELGHVDAVLDIGGFAIGDVWGIESAKRALTWSRYCSKNKKPYLSLPQAWGPFKNPQLKPIVKELCQYSSINYARDRVSYNHLMEVINRKTTKIKMAPDIALSFVGGDTQIGFSILKNIGAFEHHLPLIGISPNMRVYERTKGNGSGNEYIQLLIQIAKYCITEFNAKIILLPHEMVEQNKNKPDDRFLCGIIETTLSNSAHCYKIEDIHCPSVTKSIIEQLDFVIGSRFHVLVFSIASHVPVLAIGWAHKYKELLEMFQLGEYIIDYENLQKVDCIGLLKKAFAQRKENKNKIQTNLPQILDQIDDLFDEIAMIISENVK